MSGFHGAFATGVAIQQGTLTLPDTWFRPPFWDLLVLQSLRPDSSNLPCLYSTYRLEYPLLLSRFSFNLKSMVHQYWSLFFPLKEAKEKYKGMFEIQKSGDKSSGEIGLDIRTHASPKVGQDQVSGGISVLCWHAAPFAYVLRKPCTIR